MRVIARLEEAVVEHFEETFDDIHEKFRSLCEDTGASDKGEKI